MLLCSAPAQKIPFPRLEFVVATKDFLYQNNAVLMACPLKDSSYLFWIEHVFDELDQAPFVLHRHARTSHQQQGVTRETVCHNYAMCHSFLTLIFFTQCKDTTNTLSAHDHHKLEGKKLLFNVLCLIFFQFAIETVNKVETLCAPLSLHFGVDCCILVYNIFAFTVLSIH